MTTRSGSFYLRVIFGYLALAHIRLAASEYARAEMLERWADEAIGRARARVVTADALAKRAGLPNRFMPMR